MVLAFQHGATPEAIAFRYPALTLADIYDVVAYYLRHREEVGTHLAQRQEQAQTAEHEIEMQFPSAGIRERLFARRAGHR